MANTKFLDYTGVSRLVEKIKNTYATKDVATTTSNGLLSSEDKIKINGITDVKRLVHSPKKQYIIGRPINLNMTDRIYNFENWYYVSAKAKRLYFYMANLDNWYNDAKTVSMTIHINGSTKTEDVLITPETINSTLITEMPNCMKKGIGGFLIRPTGYYCPAPNVCSIDIEVKYIAYKDLSLDYFTSKTLKVYNSKKMWEPQNKGTKEIYDNMNDIPNTTLLYGNLGIKYIIKKRQTVENKNEMLQQYNGKKRKKRFVKKKMDTKITNGYYQLWVTGKRGGKYHLYDFVINAIKFTEVDPGKFRPNAYKFQRIT